MSGPRAHIDLGAIVDNWRMLAKRAAPAEAAAVVKADAYGLGAAQAAKALAKAGARRFYVAWAHEGVRLREAIGRGPEIAVFHGPSLDDVALFGQHDLEPVLNSLDQIALWQKAGDPARPFALHVDTGMNRLGVHAREWAEAAGLLGQAKPAWLVSHLACPDEPVHPLNTKQLHAFRTAAAMWPGARKSFASTAGVYLGADYLFDEVRPGIGLYGGGPTPANGPAPKTVVTLSAPILQIRKVTPGESVGYGATWLVDRTFVLAALGIGYADGFLRSASNCGYGVIRGQKRVLIGRVSMDLIMLDITGLPDVAVGEEVELLGPSLPIAQQAAAMSTIDYELLTRLGPRITRTWSGGE